MCGYSGVPASCAVMTVPPVNCLDTLVKNELTIGAGPVAEWLKFHTLHFGGPGSQVWIPGVDLLHSSAIL